MTATEVVIKRKVGRPKGYVPLKESTVKKILAGITLGQSLRTICREKGIPRATTIIGWLSKHDDFRERYANAREQGADLMAEDMLSISDDIDNDTITLEDGREKANSEWIARSRLRVDTRKWLLAKLHPKKYGDQLNVTGVVVNLAVVVRDARARAALIEEGDE